MSDSKIIDIDENKNLKFIFDQLLLGNITVITPEVRQELSTDAVHYQSMQIHDKVQIECMRYLVMICNILYNRTDMLVLPVEDGVYDLLLETYKKYDPQFQVGSAVVQFKSQAEDMQTTKRETVQAISFIKPIKRDPVRQQIFDRLSSFDKPKLNYDDTVKAPFMFTQDYITKRTHDTAHNHPELVGTLDKCKFVTIKEAEELGVANDPSVKILERDFFGKHIQQGIITPDQELELVLELKYDGISIEADCTREVISARTRGDTGSEIASDMTPILAGYQFHHNDILRDRTVGVKFEAIMTKTNLEKFNELKQTTYANCRTAIIGLFGSSDGYKYRDLITLVPLAIDRKDVPEVTNRIEEIELCNRLYRSHGEPLRYMYIHGNYMECLYFIKKFVEETFSFRDFVNFMYDGIVVSYLDENIRSRLGRENYINKFSMAVKFNPLSKLTVFTGYTYEVGQDGRICPMIHYEPVEFFGTIHTKSSGSGLARFKSLALKYGDFIQVTYRNDVMPYVTSIDCEHNRNNPAPLEQFPTVCPCCGTPLSISSSGKTAICPNMDCQSRVIARMSNMLQKMNVKGFAESTISTLGVKHFYEVMNLKYDVVAELIGPTNATNFMDAINRIKQGNVFDYILVGALGFTGGSTQTWKLILQNLQLETIVKLYQTNPIELIENLVKIPGIGRTTAETIVQEYPYFEADIQYILTHTNFRHTESSPTTSKQIRFSGCRNLQLQEQLIKLGYDIDGNASVTKNTDILLVPYNGFQSSKTKKVREDCQIVTIQDFMAEPEKYLN